MATDLGLIIAIVGSTAAIIGVVISMMFWVRSEANSLRMDGKEDRNNYQKEMADISRNIDKTLFAIQLDMKEYHRDLIELQKKIG